MHNSRCQDRCNSVAVDDGGADGNGDKVDELVIEWIVVVLYLSQLKNFYQSE